MPTLKGQGDMRVAVFKPRDDGLKYSPIYQTTLQNNGGFIHEAAEVALGLAEKAGVGINNGDDLTVVTHFNDNAEMRILHFTAKLRPGFDFIEQELSYA